MAMNDLGLTRDIPERVKREVRQKCGFGCVICGLGIYQYEHIDPEYHLAKIHDPAGITLLCASCHDRKTRKYLSVETVKAAMNNPRALQVGFTKDVFDVGNGHPVIRFASNTFIDCNKILLVEGQPLLSVLPPEQDGAPCRISGSFTDASGKQTLSIVNNEWMAASDNWDVEATGGRVIIREKAGKIHLVLTTHPPTGISIDKITMNYKDYIIDGDSSSLTVKTPKRSHPYPIFGNVFIGQEVGIDFNGRGYSMAGM